MPLRIRFIRSKENIKAKEPPFTIANPNLKWKKTYLPPWAAIYNFIEIITLTIFFITISNPVIYHYYLQRGAFVDALYPSMNVNEAIYSVSQVSEYIEGVTENIQILLTDSFMDIKLSPRKSDVLCVTYWRNGTVTEGECGDINLDFFLHISRLDISVDFYVYSDDPTIPGCSNWNVNTIFAAQDGLTQFTVAPFIKRGQCTPNSTSNIRITNEPLYDSNKFRQLHKTHQKEILSKLKHNQYKSLLKRNFKAKPKAPIKKRAIRSRHFLDKPYVHQKSMLNNNDNLITLERSNIPYFRSSLHLSFALLVLNIVHIIVMFMRIKQRYHRHKKWMLTSADYRNLPALDQVHFSMGYWFSIDLITSLVTFSIIIYVISDCFHITQFPSQTAIRAISFPLMFSLIRVNQWLQFHTPLYQLTTIVREAMGRLFSLYIGVIPIVTGAVLFGVFTFGLISPSFITVRNLVQRFITSGIGDSIDDFYIVIDDGTDTVAWLGFIYVSTITAGGMWIIITSCIATVMYIHEKYIIEHDSFWMSSSESDVSEY